jgi:hypothetical protein
MEGAKIGQARAANGAVGDAQTVSAPQGVIKAG